MCNFHQTAAGLPINFVQHTAKCEERIVWSSADGECEYGASHRGWLLLPKYDYALERTIAEKMTMAIAIGNVGWVMCSSHSGRHTVIPRNPLLAISTDESAAIKAPYVSGARPPTVDCSKELVWNEICGIFSTHCFAFITHNMFTFPPAPHWVCLHLNQEPFGRTRYAFIFINENSVLLPPKKSKCWQFKSSKLPIFRSLFFMLFCLSCLVINRCLQHPSKF